MKRFMIGLIVLGVLALVVPWGCVGGEGSSTRCESIVGVPASPVLGSILFFGLIAAGVMLVFRRSGGE